jgi:adenylate cyclase class 2
MVRRRKHEVEIKLRVGDLHAIRHRLAAVGARPGGRMYEANVLFDTPGQQLRRQGILLRLRREMPGRSPIPGKGRRNRRTAVERMAFGAGRAGTALVTLKVPAGQPAQDWDPEPQAGGRGAGYKVRREEEFAVSDPGALSATLAALGFHPSFLYEKFRTTYRLPRFPGLVIDLDETPIGDFLELEGSPGAIDRARRLLGYSRGEVIVASYGGLYMARCAAAQVQPGDMLFGSPGLRKR